MFNVESSQEILLLDGIAEVDKKAAI